MMNGLCDSVCAFAERRPLLAAAAAAATATVAFSILRRALRTPMQKVVAANAFAAMHVSEQYFDDAPDSLKLAGKPGMVVVDVGAHFGLVSLLLSERCAHTSRHLCFEPIPSTFQRLRANVAVVDPTGTRFTLLSHALGAEEGSVTFTYSPSMAILSSMNPALFEETLSNTHENMNQMVEDFFRPRDQQQLPRSHHAVIPGFFRWLPRFLAQPMLRWLINAISAQGAKGRTTVDCKVRRLSDVLAEHLPTGPIDLLKVDVEGAEYDVLLGINDADWARIQCLVVEIHPSLGHKGDIEALLSRHGLTVARELVTDQNTKHPLYLIMAKRA